jgi:hypothetical protein
MDYLPKDVPDDIRNIVRIITDVAESREESRMKDLTAKATRMGMRSPEFLKVTEEARAGTDEALALQVADIMNQLRGEKRQERLIDEERTNSNLMTREGWAEILKRMREGNAFAAGENEKNRVFSREERIETQNWKEKMTKNAKKDAASGAWTKLLTNVGLGVATGGFMPGLFGEDTNWLSGMLKGGVLGGSNMGNIAGNYFGGSGDWEKMIEKIISQGLNKGGTKTAGVGGYYAT